MELDTCCAGHPRRDFLAEMRSSSAGQYPAAVGLVRSRSPVLADLEAKKTIRIVGSMYNVATGKVTLI